MRKVFLDDLPRWGKGGKAKEGAINWSEAVGRKVKFIYEDIEDEIEIVGYINKKSKVMVRYLDNESELFSGSLKECNLGLLLNKITNNFKIEIGQILKDDKRDLMITDREYREKLLKDKKGYDCIKNHKWYEYKCRKCSYIGWMIEYGLLRGIGCSCCNGKTIVPEINSIWAKEPWLINLGVSISDAKKYSPNSGKKIEVICPDCGRKKEKVVSQIFKNKSIGCKICGDGKTYPEKFMTSLLAQLNIDFETQYSPRYLIRVENEKKSKKYSDFYIPKHNLILEMDGGLGHKGGKVYGKSKKTLRECIEVDEWKDAQHLEYGVETIRINCFESNMECMRSSILNSELSKTLDLSKIDWLKCEDGALKNLVKEVSQYWENEKNRVTMMDIQTIFGLSKNTVLKYLKIGSSNNWCHYDSEIARKEGAVRSAKSNKDKLSKQVKVFKNSEYLGVFASLAELSRESETLFSTKFTSGGISRVCNGKRNHHKGFRFQFVE